MDVVYRGVLEREAGELARVHIQCWREAYSHIIPVAILEATDAESHAARWEKLLKEEGRFVVAAYVAGKPAGFINAGPPREQLYDGEDGHIAAIYVLEAFHRRGIGRSLMAAAARWWRASGGKSLGLTALAENAEARRFYEALGGQLIKTGIYLWHGYALPDVVYHFPELEALARAAPVLEKGQ